jgi:hypothetical protein
VFFGVSVTIEAPLHEQRFLLIDLPHQVDAPVTGHTTDPLGDVNRMVEEDVTREIVDPSPFDGPTREIRLAQVR